MEAERKLSAVAACLLLLIAASAGARDLGGHSGRAVAGDSTDWNYAGDSGPRHWGRLSDAYSQCATGTQQSPVEITYTRYSTLPPLSFHYRTQPLDIYHTGGVIRIRYDNGSYLNLDGVRFDLKQIVFHTPGEHLIRGKRPDIEAQFIHRDYKGALVIVAVPMEGSERFNSTLSRISEHLPGKPGDNYFNRQLGINATFLLPANRSYFTYPGSLTSPPCTEGVRWFVMQNPLYVSGRQVEILSSATGDNARPVQALNSRTVLSNRP